MALRPLPRPSREERAYLSELRDALDGLSPDGDASGSPSAVAWLRNSKRLMDLARGRNPRNFLQWDVVGKTMFAERAPYTSLELSYLRHRPDWHSRWRPAIQETRVGNPTPYLYYPSSSRNLIHHAYHVAKFEETTGMLVADFGFVFEFGGGYGCMCRLIHALGFRGRYVIYDLPPFSALQLYYLKTAGLNAQRPGVDLGWPEAVVCVSKQATLANVLPSGISLDRRLFVATWSISETSHEVREIILKNVSNFEAFLVAYQDRFEDLDNLEVLERWRRALGDVVWHTWPIAHLPGNHYLMGVKAKPA